MLNTLEQAIDKAVLALEKARDILFITGAGISADSGLPTYRGIGGLYDNADPEEGLPIEMVLAGETLTTRPEITWKYLAQIEGTCRAATFNQAHRIIAEMEGLFRRVRVLTQNIDGFHAAAGSRNIIEIHGNFHDLRCTQCDWRETVRDYGGLTIPPHCPACGNIVRPDVIFFGEMLELAKVQTFLDELRQGFDVYCWIGTTGVFPYVQQPVFDAQTANRTAIEINPSPTVLSSQMDIRIPLGASQALQRIWQRLARRHERTQ